MKESTARKSLFETTRKTPICTSRWPPAAALLPLSMTLGSQNPSRPSSNQDQDSSVLFGFEMTKNTTDNISLQHVYLIAKTQNKK